MLHAPPASTTLHYLPAKLVRARWHYRCDEAHQKQGGLVRVYYRALIDYDTRALRSRQREVDRLNRKAGRR
jgi:hypothetical protein